MQLTALQVQMVLTFLRHCNAVTPQGGNLCNASMNGPLLQFSMK